MKKQLLLATGFALSIAFAQAQQVDPGNVQQIDSLRNAGSAKVDTTSLIKVKPAAVPTALRATLKDKEYSGWEKGTLYQDPKTKGYILQMKPNKGGTAKNPNWYTFDSKGKRTPDPQIKIN